MTLFLNVFCQNEESVTFEDPIYPDTLTTAAEPIGGYKALLKYLEIKISEGDTVGKKFSRHLYNVRFKVNWEGVVDSTYITVHHSECPLHYKIASELRQTRWIPAKEHGRPVSSYKELYGRLHLTKRVLKKYRCW